MGGKGGPSGGKGKGGAAGAFCTNVNEVQLTHQPFFPVQYFL